MLNAEHWWYCILAEFECFCFSLVCSELFNHYFIEYHFLTSSCYIVVDFSKNLSSPLSANKADEAARKKREKAALLAAEEDAAGSGKTVKSVYGAASNKQKKVNKKNDGLSLLEEALVGDAEKKAKDKKKMERIKKERETQMAAERERKAKEEQEKKDPLLANTDAMIGMDGPIEGNERAVAVGRAANVASMGDVQASGLDSAISAFSIGNGGDDRHPEKRMKAAYKAFEEKMMPEVKQQYPGLKRQQYLDKIFALWKKSPENPMNQQGLGEWYLEMCGWILPMLFISTRSRLWNF